MREEIKMQIFFQNVFESDYQFKVSRYMKGLTYLKNRVSTSRKQNRFTKKAQKHKIKGNHQTAKGKRGKSKV